MRTLLCVTSVFALCACSNDAPVEAPIRPVRTVTVKAEALAPEVTYSGEVVARYVTPMSFRVSGKLAQRKVDVGSKVKVGQVLAVLDLEDLKLAAATQSAVRLAAESELARAQADYDRYVMLREKKLVSEFDFKRVETLLRVAEAHAQQASAQTRVFDNQTSYGQLIADANGVVTAIQAEEGQVLGAGQPVMTVARAGEREIVIDIPESRIGELKKTQEILVALWAKPEKTYRGKVREIAPNSDPATRTYATRISIVDADADSQLGMTATVYLKGVALTAVKVPMTALYQTGASALVWVVDAANTVHQRSVEIGDFHGNDVLISTGLSDGDVVVTAGVNRVFEGQRVKRMDTAQ